MKIRTDFVTNSSSSSFVLVIRIGLKNGEVYKFIGDSGVGEGSETYYKLAALKSPEELGVSISIENMIQALKTSIIEEDIYDWHTDTYSNKEVLSERTTFIKELRRVKSMDDISTITINGDLYGRDDDQLYWHYTYYREKGITVYDKGGEDFYQEGTGGRIGFLCTRNVLEGKNYGEYKGGGKGFDKEVEPDEEYLEGGNKCAITQGHMLKGTKIYKFIDNETHIVNRGKKVKVRFNSKTINEHLEYHSKPLLKYNKTNTEYQYYDAVEYKQLIGSLLEEGRIKSGEEIPIDVLIENMKPLGPKKLLEYMERFTQEVVNQWTEERITQIVDLLPHKKDGTLTKNRVTKYYFAPWIYVWGKARLVSCEAMQARNESDNEVILMSKVMDISRLEELEAKQLLEEYLRAKKDGNGITPNKITSTQPQGKREEIKANKKESPKLRSNESKIPSKKIEIEKKKDSLKKKVENQRESDDRVWAIKQLMPSQRREAYESYLYHGKIVFKGKGFAFSGFKKTNKELIDDPIVKQVKTAGAWYTVVNASKDTDYLVIKSLEDREESKLLKALEIIESGGKLKMVLQEDVEKALNAEEGAANLQTTSGRGEEHSQRGNDEEREAQEELRLDLAGASVISPNQFMCLKHRGKVIIPEGVVQIAKFAFNMASMSEVVFPKSLKKIELCAFGECKNLKTVVFEEGIEEIGPSAFKNCVMLQEVHFPNSIRIVNSRAFDNCKSLKSVTFGENIVEIGAGAFEKCDMFQEVNLPDSIRIAHIYSFATYYDYSKTYMSDVSIHLSGKLAMYLDENNPYPSLPVIIAKEFIIDGKRYDSINKYAKEIRDEEQKRREAEERARKEAERKAAEARMAEERERQERTRREREEAERKAAEERKKAERDRINIEIYDLSQEMDSLKGVFTGMKRKKLQKHIDELKEQLRKL